MKGFWARAWRRARENPILVGFIVLGIIARVVFWAATDRKLDDALITLKFDKCGAGPYAVSAAATRSAAISSDCDTRCA